MGRLDLPDPIRDEDIYVDGWEPSREPKTMLPPIIHNDPGDETDAE